VFYRIDTTRPSSQKKASYPFVPEAEPSTLRLLAVQQSTAFFMVLESRVMGDYLARFVGGLVPSAAADTRA
jgi:hypothetical protein